MSIMDIVRKRYSVRSYLNKPVEKEKILEILEAGRLSPSAHNNQPRHYIVITDSEVKSKMSEIYRGKWLMDAPVIIAACGDHSKSWKRKDGKDHCDIDIAIAVDHMALAATDMGLGTCWVCAFDSELCHKLLELPVEYEVTALLTLGYPMEENGPEKNRYELNDVISWNKFS